MRVREGEVPKVPTDYCARLMVDRPSHSKRCRFIRCEAAPVLTTDDSPAPHLEQSGHGLDARLAAVRPRVVGHHRLLRCSVHGQRRGEGWQGPGAFSSEESGHDSGKSQRRETGCAGACPVQELEGARGLAELP